MSDRDRKTVDVSDLEQMVDALLSVPEGNRQRFVDTLSGIATGIQIATNGGLTAG